MEEKNIVKEVCSELGITQSELARMLEVPVSTVSTWATGKIPKMAQMALELMIETKQQKEILQKIKEVQNLINKI